MNIHLKEGSGWREVEIARTARRGVVSAAPPTPFGPLDSEFKRVGIEAAVHTVVVPVTRRGVERPALQFEVDGKPGDSAVTLLRHASGAITFHAPLAATAMRGTGGRNATSLQFHIELADTSPVRRGLVNTAINVVVMKIRQELIDAAVRVGLQAAAIGAETLWWKQRKLVEGWHTILPGAKGIQLQKASSADVGGGASLLFLHGTFSDTAGSFGSILKPDVVAALMDRYEGRVFGFNHFSVSRSPEQNARMLLEFLPDRETPFDVITYSRGGLVLRTMVEQAQGFGTLARRFRLDHGVLVASPNHGTPLATSRRWEETFGMLANLIDLLPDSPLTPLTTAAAFIADGLVWLAGHLSGDLPGLEALDANSAAIAGLEQRSAAQSALPPNYSAISANYHPSTHIWQKLLDSGVDGFFAGANDLVVPSKGALEVDPGLPRVIKPERAACFGPGGNLRQSSSDIHHLNILGQDETRDFIFHALQGENQDLPKVDLDHPLPSRRIWRGASDSATAARSTREELPTPTPASLLTPVPSSSAPPEPAAEADDLEGDRALHLMILSDTCAEATNGKDGHRPAQIIASYGSARVIEPFNLRDTDGDTGAGTRFRNIIRIDKRIQMNLDGQISKVTSDTPGLPNDDEMREFGEMLFDALFAPQVRRLYDLARSEQAGRPLNVVFTCAIPWVASKPWEFSFDPHRRKYLATEEIHFVRNVVTAVPAQRINGNRQILRMLVVEAEPAGTADLSIDEEERQIRFRFQPLIDTGLVQVDALAKATPELLHQRLVGQQLENRPYDIVHFIGHGEFDRAASQGSLLFNSNDGGAYAVDTRTLRELLCGRGLQLVFLNACDTGRDAIDLPNRGVASSLIEAGLPAVVANQYKVLDPSAVAFAQQFYWALANGASLGEAAREARVAVNYSIDGEIIDWAVPVLYARNPDLRLCARRSDAIPLLGAAPRRERAGGTVRGAKPKAQLRIGVADIARFFVGLEDILARLNSAQERIQFRLVDVNTPMGVWLRDPASNKTYLDVERFAKKLEDRHKALGVDLVGCITNWWMFDGSTYDLYSWWDAERNVAVFSTAGLALPGSGPVAGRTVANEMVASIGGWLYEANVGDGDTPIHDRGATNCVFYYNQNRDLASVSGRLEVCPECRRLFSKALPTAADAEAILAAFDALLAAYDAELGVPPPRAMARPKPVAPPRATTKHRRG